MNHSPSHPQKCFNQRHYQSKREATLTVSAGDLIGDGWRDDLISDGWRDYLICDGWRDDLICDGWRRASAQGSVEQQFGAFAQGFHEVTGCVCGHAVCGGGTL